MSCVLLYTDLLQQMLNQMCSIENDITTSEELWHTGSLKRFSIQCDKSVFLPVTTKKLLIIAKN